MFKKVDSSGSLGAGRLLRAATPNLGGYPSEILFLWMLRGFYTKNQCFPLFFFIEFHCDNVWFLGKNYIWNECFANVLIIYPYLCSPWNRRNSIRCCWMFLFGFLGMGFRLCGDFCLGKDFGLYFFSFCSLRFWYCLRWRGRQFLCGWWHLMILRLYFLFILRTWNQHRKYA